MADTSRWKVVSAFLLALILISVLRVNAQVVSDEWKNSIEAYLHNVDVDTTVEIVIYIVQSLSGHGVKKEGSEINEIVKLGVHIFNELPLETPDGPVVGIGKKGKDNGVLVLVAMEEHEWRIEVGYGLEGYITDIESNLVAQQYLVPKFQEEKYGEGLYDTIVALSQKIPAAAEGEGQPIRGKYLYENSSESADGEMPLWVTILVIAIFGGVIVVAIIVVYLVKKGKIKAEKGKWTGSGRRGSSSKGSGGRTPSGGRRGGGGRSGGGGAKGKW